MRRPLTHRTARREFSGLLRSRPELQALTFGDTVDVPVTVISGGHTHRCASPLRRAATAEHERLADGSPDGRHIVVAHGGHLIHRYQPDIVVAAIGDLLDRISLIQQQRPQPTTPTLIYNL
jgi:pimeloyl-ACP methyl ester carboxylesterase